MSRACAAHAERGGGEWVCRAELARLSKALERAKECVKGRQPREPWGELVVVLLLLVPPVLVNNGDGGDDDDDDDDEASARAHACRPGSMLFSWVVEVGGRAAVAVGEWSCGRSV